MVPQTGPRALGMDFVNTLDVCVTVVTRPWGTVAHMSMFTRRTLAALLAIVALAGLTGCSESKEDELYQIVADARQYTHENLLGAHWLGSEPYEIQAAYSLVGSTEDLGLNPKNARLFTVYAARIDIRNTAQDVILFWAELDLDDRNADDPIWADSSTRPYSQPAGPCSVGELCDDFVEKAKNTPEGRAVIRAAETRMPATPWTQA